MKNRECEIIQDLILGYIDDVLNPETKKYVENHLQECEDCRNKIEFIKNDIKENEIDKKNNKKVDYLKKIRRKGKTKSLIIFFILAFIISLVGIHTIRNIIIFKSIDEKQARYSNVTNYHVINSYYSGKNYVVHETYFKNDVSLSTLIRYNNDSGLVKMTFYNSGDDHRMYVDTKNNNETSKKVYFNDTASGMLMMDSYTGEAHLYSNLLVDSLLTNISNSKCNGKDCYILESKYSPWMLHDQSNSISYSYIEKETGLIIRGGNGVKGESLGGEFDVVSDWFYEFDSVTDKNLTPPNIDDYEIEEVNK